MVGEVLPLRMPAASSDDNNLSKMIADALQDLSMKERETVYEDIHGVNKPFEETPEIIEQKLQEMEQEIARIAIKDKFAYQKALHESPEFVWNKKFRLSFLRATMFDTAQAAEKIVLHFKLKFETFGAQKLGKRITLDDLTDLARNKVGTGGFQILPTRASQGRPVLVNFPSTYDFRGDYETVFVAHTQAFWYILSSMIDDEESQRRGGIFVTYAVGTNEKPDPIRKRLVWACTVIARALPIRLSGFHYCHDAPKMGLFLPVVARAAGSFIRVRIRTHLGSHSECQYKLMSFGIPITNFPMSLNGKLNTTNHKKWLERRIKKERFLTFNPHAEGTDLPLSKDVLLGRGVPYVNHPGNKHLHELVGSSYDEYNKSIFESKTRMAEEIVVLIQNYGGRFLKRDEESDMWVEVSNLEARNKVSHSFRRKREYDVKQVKFSSHSTTNDEGGNKRLRMFYDK